MGPVGLVQLGLNNYSVLSKQLFIHIRTKSSFDPSGLKSSVAENPLLTVFQNSCQKLMSSSLNTAALRFLLAPALPALEEISKSLNTSKDDLIATFLEGLASDSLRDTLSTSFADAIRTRYKTTSDAVDSDNLASKTTIQSLLETISGQSGIDWLKAAYQPRADRTRADRISVNRSGVDSEGNGLGADRFSMGQTNIERLILNGIGPNKIDLNRPSLLNSFNNLPTSELTSNPVSQDLAIAACNCCSCSQGKLSWHSQIQLEPSDANRTYQSLIPQDAAAFTTVARNGQRIYNGQGSAQPLKWTNTNNGQTNITFAFDNDFGINGLSFDRAKSLFVNALSTWSQYAPLNFQEIQDPGAGDRVDIYVQSRGIDGQGGTLAFAYFPTVGDITFDNTERWNNDKFLETAVHELGHSLGLDHEGDVDAIMNPVLNNRFAGSNNPFLLQDDVNGIQNLYGGGQGTVSTIGQGEASEESPSPEFVNNPPATNLVNNGSFEDTPVGANSSAVYRRIKGWTQLSGAGFLVDKRNQSIQRAADGSAWVELDVYGQNSTIYQNVDTVTGQNYTLSVDFTNNGRNQASTRIDVFWEGKRVDRLTGGGLNDWKNYQFQVKGGDRSVSTLAFRGVGNVDSVGGLIDNISVIASANATADQTVDRGWENRLQQLGQSEASASNSAPLAPVSPDSTYFVPELIASEYQIFPDVAIPV